MSSDIEKLEDAIEQLKKYADHLTCEASIEPSLTTPAGIRFIVDENGRVLAMLFNDDKQSLHYKCNVFAVSPTAFWVSKIVENLPLHPCKYGDLKDGEFFSLKEKPALCDIQLKLPMEDEFHRNAKVNSNGTIIPYNFISKPCWKIG